MKKSLIVAAVLTLMSGQAFAQSSDSSLDVTPIIESFRCEANAAVAGKVNAQPIRTQAASISSIVEGVFYLSSTTCVGASDSFNTRLNVKQSGRNFTVTDPAGLKLKGVGGARGFTVTKKIPNRTSGVTTFVEMSAGPVSSKATAKFRLSMTLRNTSGAQCQSVFTGTLNVYRAR